jgi:hypothetical protein
MSKRELRKLCRTRDWRWATWEGAELHTLLLGLLSTFREKLEWLEEMETLSLRFRASRAREKRRPETGNQKPGGRKRRLET